MINYLKKHPFIACLVIQCFILVCYFISGTMKYEVSDDFMMQLMVSGAYGTTASDMMFTSPILAISLSFLYQLIPSINWYFYFQALLIFMSLTIISYVFIKEKRHPLILSLVFALLLFVAKDFYQLMQFTKTATIVLCAACFLGIYAMKHQKMLLVPAIGLLIIGMMFRLKCIYMAFPALAVYVLMDVWKHRHDFINTIKPYFILLICAGVCYLGVSVSNQLFDQQSELQAYDKFNHERVSINDVKAIPYEDIKSQLAQIHVSENDYQMMLSWNFGDEAFFTTETMGKVADIMAQHQNHNIKDALYSMFHRQYWTYFIFWFLLISVGICCIYFKSIPQAILMGVMGIALLFVNAYVSRNVYRVEISTFVSCALFYFYSLLENRKTISNKWIFVPVLCMSLLSIVGMIPIHGQDNYAQMNASWDHDIRKYQLSFRQSPLSIVEEIESNPQNTYLLGFQSCIQSLYLHYDPVVDQGSSLLKNAIYLGGVDFNHPLRNEWMRQHHLDNTMQALLKEDVYFVEHLSQQQILTYLQEHYHKDITMKLVKEIDGYQIWKFIKPE